MPPRRTVKIADYPINTLVRITASGGQSGDWWQRVALTGGSQLLGSYHHTIIQVINPDTGELSQQPWRTEWLEVLPQGEQLEEVEALQRAIARVKSEYSESGAEQEQSSRNESDIPDESISVEHLEVPMVDGLPPQSEQSESEAVVTTVEVVSELTEEELADLKRLELKVERAFYEAALAIRELHSRKLYRSTHSRFDHYCRDRFGFSQQNADLLIRAAGVIDNLKTTTNGCNFLPTSERQVRPLTKLEPDEQRQAWEEAVLAAGGKVPSGRVVKGIVSRLKERDNAPPPIPYKPNDVFLICCKVGPLRKYDRSWAIAIQINEYTVSVHVHDADLPVKPENLDPIDSPSECKEIRAIAQRITRLRQCDSLDRGAYYVLEGIGRQTFLTEVESGLLCWLENHYGVV